jgi:predicted DNA-binding transcriptional regulator AlpA
VADNNLPLANPDWEAVAEAIARRLVFLLRVEERALLDRRQLATRLGIAVRTVNGLVARKELPPPLRVGGCVRWNWAEVIEFLAGRRQHRPRRGRGRYDRRRQAD